MKVKKLLPIFLSIIAINYSALAADKTGNEEHKASAIHKEAGAHGETAGAEASNINANSDKIIADYKAYLATIKPELRNEVVTYRKDVAKINKQKRELYHKLSQEAQNYLAKEQEYKRKLPIRQKKFININNGDTTATE